jgi:hypothetical protein
MEQRLKRGLIKVTHVSALGDGGNTVAYIQKVQTLPGKAVLDKADFPNEFWNEMYVFGKTVYITGTMKK